MSESDLIAELDSIGAAWTLHEHEAVFTVEESARLHEEIAGAHTKNLFLKDARGGYWLVTAPHDLPVDLKALAAALEAKKFSFGKAEDMEAMLGVTPGAVTPLAAMNDSEGRVRVVMDSRLAEADVVNVHPLRNTATIGLSGHDLQLALARWNHAPTVIGVPERS